MKVNPYVHNERQAVRSVRELLTLVWPGNPADHVKYGTLDGLAETAANDLTARPALLAAWIAPPVQYSASIINRLPAQIVPESKRERACTWGR